MWFSAICNFAAYFFVGTAVANTVAKTVKPGSVTVAVVFAALFAAIVWNYVTWHIGMPSSSSHAIIGGLIGAGFAAGGVAVVAWSSVRKTVLAIVASPAVALSVAVVATLLVIGIQRITGLADDAKPFKWLQLVSAAAVSFGHGANDAQKTMGVIAALLAGAGYLDVAAGSEQLPVPEWVALASYSAIALGTAWGGWKIIDTMGLRLTRLNARTGVAANIGATTAIFGATQLGIPISTTHAAASSVVGAGTAARQGTNWKVIGEMVAAWIATIPATAAISWLCTRRPSCRRPFAAVAVGTAVVVCWPPLFGRCSMRWVPERLRKRCCRPGCLTGPCPHRRSRPRLPERAVRTNGPAGSPGGPVRTYQGAGAGPHLCPMAPGGGSVRSSRRAARPGGRRW